MARAIGFGATLVVIYAVTILVGLRSYWFEFALVILAAAGIGVLVARTRGDRPFLKAGIVSFLTVLCNLSLAWSDLAARPAWEQPAVMTPPMTMVLAIISVSLMIGAMGGAVALGLRSFRAPHADG